MYVNNADAAKREVITDGTNAFKQVLIGSDVGPNFALRRFIIEPGGSIPMHTNEVEHEQFVLRGKAEISVDGNVYNVKQNDFVFMPAGAPHYYINTSEEPFEFLCIVPNKPDKIEFVK